MLLSLAVVWVLTDALKNPSTVNIRHEVKLHSSKFWAHSDTTKRIPTIFDSSYYFGYMGNLEMIRNQILDNRHIQRVLSRPVPPYHALTAEDRTRYVLSIDQDAIKKPNDTTIFGKRYKVTHVPVKLTNSSGDTLKYLSIDCSWLDIYLTDNRDIEFAKQICYKNGTFVEVVLPHHIKIVYIPILLSSNTMNQNSKFRTGMSLQKFNEKSRYFDFDIFAYLLRPETRDIIWSNEVVIQ